MRERATGRAAEAGACHAPRRFIPESGLGPALSRKRARLMQRRCRLAPRNRAGKKTRSFPRRRESIARCSSAGLSKRPWIPAFAGMTGGERYPFGLSLAVAGRRRNDQAQAERFWLVYNEKSSTAPFLERFRERAGQRVRLFAGDTAPGVRQRIRNKPVDFFDRLRRHRGRCPLQVFLVPRNHALEIAAGGVAGSLGFAG